MSLIASVEFSEDIPTHVRKLLEGIADYSKKGQWELALSLSTIALEEMENVLESDSHDIGLILSVVGFINTKVDKYYEAESALRKAILILERGNKGSDFVVTILRDVVELFIKNEEYEEAEFFGKKAIRIYQKLHKIDKFKLAEQRVTIGEVLLQLRKPKEARTFFERALSVYARKFSSDSPQIEKIFKLLEIVHFWRNNIIKSKKRLENVNNRKDAFPFLKLGVFCEKKFPYKAIDYYQRVVKIEESQSCPNNVNSSRLRLKLGKCYLKIDRRLAAQHYLEKSRVIHKKTVPNNIQQILDINIQLAFCYFKLARLDDARKMFEEVLKNVYTDGSDVPILKLAEDYAKSEKNKAPTLRGKSNIIDCALKDLSALYVLDGKYGAAKILQDFGESRHDLFGDDEI